MTTDGVRGTFYYDMFVTRRKEESKALIIYADNILSRKGVFYQNKSIFNNRWH